MKIADGICSAVEMMMTEMIDLAAFSDPTYYQQLYDLGFEGITYTNTDQFIQINGNGKTEASGRFLSNANFRRALSYAIDRTALVNTVMLGQTPAYRVIDPDAAGLNGKFVDEYPVENQINVTADPAKAQEYVETGRGMQGGNISGKAAYNWGARLGRPAGFVGGSIEPALGISDIKAPVASKTDAFRESEWYKGLPEDKVNIIEQAFKDVEKKRKEKK